MALVALKTDSGVRDFQEKAPTLTRDLTVLAISAQHEQSNSTDRSSASVSVTEPKYDIDMEIGHRYLFIAKEISNEMRTKQPNLEISVAKHIAEIFCLRHRSTVFITTVCGVFSLNDEITDFLL